MFLFRWFARVERKLMAIATASPAATVNAEAGNAYRVLHDTVTSPRGYAHKDAIINGDDYPEIERLVRIKAVMPLPGVMVPRATAAPEELMENVQEQQEEVIRLQARVDQLEAELASEKRAHVQSRSMLEAENKKCYEEIAGLELQLTDARQGRGTQAEREDKAQKRKAG